MRESTRASAEHHGEKLQSTVQGIYVVDAGVQVQALSKTSHRVRRTVWTVIRCACGNPQVQALSNKVDNCGRLQKTDITYMIDIITYMIDIIRRVTIAEINTFYSEINTFYCNIIFLSAKSVYFLQMGSSPCFGGGTM